MGYFWIYILRCSDDSYYIGHTDDIERRVSEHRSGRFGGYIAQRLPVVVVYTEAFSTRAEAIIAEQKLKKWSRKKKEIVIYEGWAALKSCKRRD
jgi:predicted GIY-YIG superfamily endonuclease